MSFKKYFMIFTAAVLLSSTMNAAEQTDSITLSIQAMHCGKCVHKVSNILRANTGIETYTFDEERRTVSVAFNPQQTCKDSIMAQLAATKRYIPKVYSADEVMPRTIRQRVADMHCDKCAHRIVAHFTAMNGIDSVATDTEQHNVLIRYDANKTRKDSIRQAFTALGFTPVNVLMHHEDLVPGISYVYLNIPESAANDNTVEELMAIDGIADVCVNAKKKTLAITYADKYFATPDALLKLLRETGVEATLPPTHQCKEN